ncbi:MAG: hypothetical protein WCP55_19735 [Lentisphaerota bacterium]
MRNITEVGLLNLGFERQDVSIEESGQDKPFYYFTFEIDKLCLISNSNDECVGKMYNVEFFDYSDAVRFTDIKILSDLVEILKSNRI